MHDYQLNRRQALMVGGLGALSMGMPGAVFGSDNVDAQGNATRSEKSCIFVLLCGGPEPPRHLGPEARRPGFVPRAVPADRHQGAGHADQRDAHRLAKLTDQFTLIRSMTHPGTISNHFDAMHNLLSGQSVKRVQQGQPDDSRTSARSWPSTSRASGTSSRTPG